MNAPPASLIERLLQEEFPAAQPGTINVDELATLLQPRILQLLHTDRPRLIQLLYRVDVSEEAARQALALPVPEAAARIARLLAERYHKKSSPPVRHDPSCWRDV